MRTLPLLILLLALTGFVPAGAQEVEENDKGEVVFTDGQIETTQPTEAEDENIEARLTNIFAALPAFDGIEVEVTGGVVRLSGMVTSRTAASEAEAVASRISGVVAVDNAISTDLSVNRQLGPATERAQQLARDSIALLPLLAVAITIVIVFWLLGLFLGRQRWLWRRIAPNTLVAGLFGMIIPLVFIMLGLVIALNILDAVAVLSAVLGAAGVLGLAVGFAVRDSIENFIASVMLSLRQPFRPKDLVDIDGQEGHVVRLTSRATILMSRDGNHVRIPNAQVFKAIIVNYTRNPERRFSFELGVDANDDPQAAIETGLAQLETLEFILKDPEPTAWIEKVGDSNIVLSFAAWIDQAHTDFAKAKSASIRIVKNELEAKGFTLPEPIYRLRIDQMPEGVVLPKGSATVTTASSRPEPATATGPVDVAPDRSIEEKVAEDRAETGEADLLSDAAPTEFGDEGKAGL
ncbi:mechanosensitive ion channel family protein [Parvularcula marina]|uniref:mechanosensitive ion channel family protein n=1 Tax=Parvularcula marina TaxID=2292771 RepID=UPI001314F454|nr:mechanosensitive ion channel family protein [Parvularcula marina]